MVNLVEREGKIVTVTMEVPITESSQVTIAM